MRTLVCLVKNSESFPDYYKKITIALGRPPSDSELLLFIIPHLFLGKSP